MNKREAQELLPWFVAGSLSADETRAVQAFIESGEISAAELDEIALFAETVNEQHVDEPAYNPAILDNVMLKLDDVVQEAPTEPLIVAEPQAHASAWEKLVARLQWAVTPPVARVALAGQFVLVVALGAAIFANQSSVEEQSEFTTVYGASVKSGATADFNIALEPGATVAELQALLGNVEAQIVSGPTSMGIYSIDVADDDQLDAARTVLSEHPITVFVQPVPQQ